MDYSDKCKQLAPFYVKTVRCADGERLPTLLDRASGVPDFDATLWVVSSLRSNNFASSTIEQALRSIILLYLVFRRHKINLTERLREGRLLDPEECEAISKVAKQKAIAASFKLLDFDETDSQGIKNRIVGLEKFRGGMAVRDRYSDVVAGTSAIRMWYIRSFLNWRVNREILRAKGKKRASLITIRNLVNDELKNKTPVDCGRDTVTARMGINRESQSLLLNVVTPVHPQNPWKNAFISLRNQLIVAALLTLGVRRGELLGLRIGDFKPQTQEVMILRRPDDISDPRLNEPNTKTRDRVLPLSADLYRLVKVYLPMRHAIVRKGHEFLLVANTGEPLSKSGLNRLFSTLDSIPGLPKIVPHILRHSFCENLADDLHRAGITGTEIEGYLRQQGGWSDTSLMPRRYTKRFTQELANEAGISMQKKLLINVQSERLYE